MADKMPDVHAIFNEAIELESDDERAEYLDEACQGDPQVMDRVEELLRAHSDAGSFLWGRSPTPAPTIDQPPVEQAGSMIGPYKLIEEIGEGGMGSVFVALQKEPVRRKVALKVIKPGMDSKEVIARFGAERQALALMDHPNIAKVLDAASTDSGRPYFVMELVRGYSLIDYCDRTRLSTRERLGQFIQVCQAVQHAHQKGVIHRDLKPSNVMVTLHDGVPVPKVIDFGIAKAISGNLTDATLVTNYSQVIGTPLYMSPEQAEMGGLDIDTRSDVYSLGVLLYELLTGTTPFDRERMKEVSYDEFRRIIREEEPPRPSTRLSTLDAALDTVAEKHHTDPRTLSHEVGGELDWIVMKSLEKDRARRYESANELAKDVRRYLDDEAVEACPPSTVYRFRKLMRRHRGKLAAVATVAVVLVLATVVSTCLAAWAVRVEGIAKTEHADALDARQLAEKAAEIAREQQQLAKEQEELAEKQRDAAEYGHYVSNMRLAPYERTQGSTYSFLQLLNTHVPGSGRRDFRGWEWYYHFSQGNSERLMFPFQRVRHGAGVRNGESAIAWSADGQRLAAVDQLGLVDIWDVFSGERKASLKGCSGRINSICWSPDAEKVAVGSDRRTVTIWDVATSEKLQTLYGHTAEVLRVDWSPDGARIASGADDGTILVWDSKTGETLLSLAWIPTGPGPPNKFALNHRCFRVFWGSGGRTAFI